MKLSKLIEILAQYLQEHGDIEIFYSDSEMKNLEEITEMDLNIQKGYDRLVLTTILEEKWTSQLMQLKTARKNL